MFLYLYVLAAAIAVFGMIVVFRSTMDNMLTEPEKFPQHLNRFFTKFSILEILPIAMIVLGFIFPPSEQLDMSDALIPIVIIGLLMIIHIFYIFSQRSPAGNVEKELKQRIQPFIFLAMALGNAVPIIAIVFILLIVS